MGFARKHFQTQFISKMIGGGTKDNTPLLRAFQVNRKDRRGREAGTSNPEQMCSHKWGKDSPASGVGRLKEKEQSSVSEDIPSGHPGRS